jgi:hypothetical protein
VATPIAATVPDVVSLLEQISTSPVLCYVAINQNKNPFLHTYTESPPDTILFQLARLAIYLHCPTSGLYKLSNPVPII